MAMKLLLAAVTITWTAVALAEGVPVGRELAAQIQADIDWQDRVSERKANPSGEVMGAATWDDASGGVDGVKNGSYGFHTTYSENPWWQVDLERSYELGRVVIYNRMDSDVRKRAYGMMVLVSPDGKAWQEVFRHTDEEFGGVPDGKPLVVDLTGKGVSARWVRCQMPKTVSFHLDEVEVYPTSEPDTNVALHKPADQSSAGRSSTSKGLNPRSDELSFTLEGTARMLERAGGSLLPLRDQEVHAAAKAFRSVPP